MDFKDKEDNVTTIGGAVVREEHTEGRLKKDYSTLSIIGVGYCITNSWCGIASTLSVGIVQGGPVVLVYGFLLIVVVFICIALSLSELASAMPSAAGQYLWAYNLAPDRRKREFAFVTAFLNVASWITVTASVCLLGAQFIMAMVVINNPDFVIRPWHYFVLYQVNNFGVNAFTWYGLHKCPWTYQVGLLWSIGLFIVTFFSMLCGPGSIHSRGTTDFVWKTFTNDVGWTSSAVVFLTGLINPNYGFAGIDGAIHLAEDSKDPVRDVPKALLGTLLTGSITAWPWLIVALYSIQDFDAIETTTTGMPVFVILLQCLKSKPAVIFIGTCFFVNNVLSLAGCQQSAGRLTWVLAGDEGLIGSRWLARINPKVNNSAWALGFNAFWVFVIGCLYLASTTVYNAIVGSNLILGHLSYAIPVGLLLYRKRAFATRPWLALGSFGWLANVVTVLWAVLITVFYCFPADMPVSGSTMNYASVVIVVVLLLAAVNWIGHGRKSFTVYSALKTE